MKGLRFFILVIVISMLLFQCKTSENGDNNNEDNNNGGGENTEIISSEYIINHNCTDLSQIPDQWLDLVRQQFRVHYAHTSHGGQIVVGLQRLSNGIGITGASFSLEGKYNFCHKDCSVPTGADCLRMMDGQKENDYCETYITPDLYWESDYGMNLTRSVLQNFDVNMSLWAWCSQQDYYNQAETQTYLDRMAQLEQEFPHVTFIYMTGNAQSEEQNRLDRNNQIREYCKEHQKFLFDFADLDCWYNGEQHVVNGIPMEHPHYHGDEAAHTTYESCENKGRAFWWLMARLAGWDGE